jgi:hypothetical protein
VLDELPARGWVRPRVKVIEQVCDPVGLADELV